MDVEKKLIYPYSYMMLGAVAFASDIQNGFITSKIGSAHQAMVPNTPHGERSTTNKAFTWPITVDLEYHYVNSDPETNLLVLQALAIISAMGNIRYDIRVADYLELGCRLEIPVNTAIPISSAEDPQNPTASDITCNMILHTHVGFLVDVAAVNGNVNYQVIMSDESVIEGALDESD
jgi:hypothetical protein